MPLIPSTPVLRLRLAAVVVLALSIASCSTKNSHVGVGAAQEPALTAAETPPPQELWRWKVPWPGSAGMPSVSAGPDARIAFTYGHIALVLLDQLGTEQWRADRVGLRDVAPLLTPSAVLAATDEGVVAFDRNDGRLLWDRDLGDRANTPLEAGGVVVATTWDGSFVGLDSGDGSVRWRTLLPGAALGPPAAHPGPGATVLATWDSGLRAGAMAVSATDGRVLWEAALPPGGVSGPAVVPIPETGPDGPTHVVVIVSGDLAAHALAADDGRHVWRADLEASGSPEVPPSMAPGGDVVVGHRLGGLALLDAASGHLRWSAASDGAAVRGGPVAATEARVAMPLDDGRVLVVDGARRLQWRPGEGRVSGVALSAGGTLLVATRGPEPAAVIAYTPWGSGTL